MACRPLRRLTRISTLRGVVARRRLTRLLGSPNGRDRVYGTCVACPRRPGWFGLVPIFLSNGFLLSTRRCHSLRPYVCHQGVCAAYFWPLSLHFIYFNGVTTWDVRRLSTLFSTERAFYMKLITRIACDNVSLVNFIFSTACPERVDLVGTAAHVRYSMRRTHVLRTSFTSKALVPLLSSSLHTS